MRVEYPQLNSNWLRHYQLHLPVKFSTNLVISCSLLLIYLFCLYFNLSIFLLIIPILVPLLKSYLYLETVLPKRLLTQEKVHPFFKSFLPYYPPNSVSDTKIQWGVKYLFSILRALQWYFVYLKMSSNAVTQDYRSLTWINLS